MKKIYLFLLLAVVCIAGRTAAQEVWPCSTDEMTKKYKEIKPEIIEIEKKLEAQIQNYISHNDLSKLARKTSGAGHDDTDYYDIPLVAHVIHNYGQEYLTDNQIYNLVAEMNRFYSHSLNYSAVINIFKPYIGNPKIRFHLATIDPHGNPTKGITRHRSYLTYGYDDQGKLDQWNPTSYVNIWFENVIGATTTGGIIVAYATPPASAAGFPPYDGIISNYAFINDAGVSNTQGGSIDHEMGHILNLFHTFGRSNNPHTNTTGNCGDDDGVDDTPPTEGNLGGCHLYDSICASHYFKIYANVSGGDSLVDYPDTSNEQNIMNYADCKVMFTKGQVTRMRAALNNDVAGRNNLWDSTNLIRTGIGSYNSFTKVLTAVPFPDLKPNPEFSAVPVSGSTTSANYMDRNNYFTFPGVSVKFVNETWNDTVTSLTWTFSNTAAVPTVTQSNPTMNSSSVNNSFADPGWVTLSMKATGNHSGDTTVTFPRSVFVADEAATPGLGYFQEFNDADTAKWPMFNYYGNNLKWKMANVGYYDNNSVEFVGFDDRTLFITGNPRGDFDDLYSVPFDLSMFGSGPCSMNFFYSAASRSAMSLDINDQLEIAYSTNKSTTWNVLTTMKKSSLENKGAYSLAYAPLSTTDWALFSMNLPTAARTPYTVFRFRYKPSTKVGFDGTLASGSVSSGNNFYMDRLTFSPWTAGVDNLKMANIDVAVMPNPTSGDAYVIISDADNTTANITVTDITGKVVYTVAEQLTSNKAQVLIPHAALQVSGLYLVHVVTGNQSRTQKLIVQ